MMDMVLHRFELPLRHSFTISRESIDRQPTLIVELRQAGFRGYGEATSNRYYDTSIESMVNVLESLRPEILRADCNDPAQLWSQFDSTLSRHRFAQCALDQAAYDLWGKLNGQSVSSLWGLDRSKCPASNYTIGIDSIETMVAKMNQFPNWPIYKIKLGTEHDLDIVRELRSHTSAIFRVDANCGWTADETIRNATVLRELNVEFIEQPLPAEQIDEMPAVRRECELPVIADESCQEEHDVAHCEGKFDGINIKLVKCGGLTPARRMISVARERGLKVMVGCMTESTVGISAIAQLLPELDYVDMDGASLLAEDIAKGASVVNGVCHFPDENGTGVELLAAGSNQAR